MAAQDLTVCDIIGDWGGYQWSVTLFGVVYSALAAVPIVVGPLWTPDMAHVCKRFGPDGAPERLGRAHFQSDPRQCFESFQALEGDNVTRETIACAEFAYEPGQPRLLTNSFDLVCDRKWMRSLVSSSSLLGMLISSVTLGFISDRYGRMRCMAIASTISILATLGAILAPNYSILNLCFLLMSYSQIGIGNTLLTLVMESTSPRLRFVAVFEYGVGWSLGILLAPLLNELTQNYQHMFGLLLVWQLAMIIWHRFGVFESIRWLLSEGKITRAQIELRRACRMNRVQNSLELAHKIAGVQLSQLRKASMLIEEKSAPARLARATDQTVETAGRELGKLSLVLRRSFAIEPVALDAPDGEPAPERRAGARSERESGSGNADHETEARRAVLSALGIDADLDRPSITTQGLVELALKCSKTLQKEDEGGFFLAQVFHRKLYKLTLVLMLVSLMLEGCYFGLMQANRVVGDSVNLNYVTGALSEILANFLCMLVLWLMSRRAALIWPTLVAALACLLMALAYQMWPDVAAGAASASALGEPARRLVVDTSEANITNFQLDQLDSAVLEGDRILTPLSNSSGPLLLDAGGPPLATGAPPVDQPARSMVALRNSINVWLMAVGKMALVVASQVVSTITLESYPSNLRQTAVGFLCFIGRIASILAPFLFNDTTLEKTVLKCSLLAIGLLGFLVSALVPCFVPDNKKNELCDRIYDIAEQH